MNIHLPFTVHHAEPIHDYIHVHVHVHYIISDLVDIQYGNAVTETVLSVSHPGPAQTQP